MKISINKLAFAIVTAMILVTSFYSCSDDNFVDTETEIEQSEPETVEYTFVTGIVTDKNGSAISNIEVEYLTAGELKSTTTDQDGKYEIVELEEEVTRIKVKCNGQGYLPKIEVVHINADRTVENDIILVTEEQTSSISIGNQGNQSLSDSLLSLSGRVVNATGAPVPGIIVYLIDYNFTTWLYSVTDSDGRYEFATEALPQAVLLAGSECESVETLIELVTVEADTEVEDATTTIIPSTFVSISGFITDCFTGEGLSSGEISFSYEGENKVFRTDIVNGNYTAEIPLCLDVDCLQATVNPYLAQTSIAEIDCVTFEVGANNTFDYEICTGQTTTDNGGFFTYTVDGQTYEHPLVGVESDGTNYEISGLNITQATSQEPNAIIVQTVGTSENGTCSGVFVGNLQTFVAFYNAEPGAVSYQIDSTTTEFMYGSINGNIINLSNGQSTTIEGAFKAAIQ